MSEGYLFFAGGSELYYKLLQRVVRNLREFDPVRPVCILSDDIERAKQYCPYENLIFKRFYIERHIVPTVSVNNTWHRWGFYPKVFQMLYSPFEKTMFFDVDYVFKTDFKFWWDHFNQSEKPFLIAGLSDSANLSPPDWLWGTIYTVSQKMGVCIPQVCSSFMIYEKKFLKIFIKHVQLILMNLPNWSVPSNYCNGYPDEIVFAILLGMIDMTPDKDMFDWVIDPVRVLSCDKSV
jgi:hypothetical protein